MQVQSLGWEDPLEKGVATHSSILAWRIPWTEEPGGLQFIGSQRAGHNWSDWAHMQDLGLSNQMHLLWSLTRGPKMQVIKLWDKVPLATEAAARRWSSQSSRAAGLAAAFSVWGHLCPQLEWLFKGSAIAVPGPSSLDSFHSATLVLFFTAVHLNLYFQHPQSFYELLIIFSFPLK